MPLVEVTITTLLGKSKHSFPVGSTVLRAATEVGIEIDAVCGGSGTCGKCKVLVEGNVSPPTQIEQSKLEPAELERGVRLACQVSILGQTDVRILEKETGIEPAILTEGRRRDVSLDPAVRELHIEVPKPTLEGNPSDLEDLIAATGRELSDTNIPLDLLRDIPSTLRAGEYAARVVMKDGRLIAIGPQEDTGGILGCAFDIGTTTVVGKLYDLRSGRLIAVASRLNAQRAFGEDVVSRIHHAMKSKRDLFDLQTRIISVLNDIVVELCTATHSQRKDIYEIVCAGNTVMTHLALGVDPRHLAEMPYVPAFRSAIEGKGSELGFEIHPRGSVWFLPGIGRFVGGDTVAVILTSALDESTETKLAVDVGTNGEIVVGSMDKLLACSTAAGPAFEGAHIKHGMRAATGAIDRVHVVDGRIQYHVIGEGHAQGLCGSGLIDTIAELLRMKIIDSSGRIVDPDELPSGVPQSVCECIKKGEKGNEFVLAQDNGMVIALTQRDVREVQLAKGAIAAGTKILMRELGLQATDLSEILLAGAFGNFIRRENAIRIGLLPQISADKVSFIGNAACAGAEMALLSRPARARSEEIARKVKYVEISAASNFQTLFAEEMMFPTGDPE